MELPESQCIGKVVVAGRATGNVLHADVGLSFWGGVDPSSGRVIDHQHPLHGADLAGKVLAIPSSRGSCTGSQVILELLLNGRAPAAILLSRPDEIIALGVIIAEELFGHSLPVVSLGDEGFNMVAGIGYARVEQAVVHFAPHPLPQQSSEHLGESDAMPTCADVALSAKDQAMLDGEDGQAVQTAMRIVVRAAGVQKAQKLIDVSQVHIDGCTYGHPGSPHPAGLRFAKKFVELGGQVRVPTTLNSLSVDLRRWRKLGVPAEFGEPAAALGEAYVSLGCKPSFTCAPYQLDSAPGLGDQIAWGESNAVVFANSVLGAKTQKYADFLDLCIALTGRAPHAGCHLQDQRRARVVLNLPRGLDDLDDAFYPTLGYLCGLKSEGRIPAVTGLEKKSPGYDNLKAFSAAFGTTASVPMFHIVGVTPEAPDLTTALAHQEPDLVINLTPDDLAGAWKALDSSSETVVDFVSLGNPHFSLQELGRLAELCHGRRKHRHVDVVVTSGREVLEKARAAGHVAALEAFGVQFVNDTCWCMIGEPVVPTNARTLITNSAKYAHYGPGVVSRKFRFANLAGCVSAACTREAPHAVPIWLQGRASHFHSFAGQVRRSCSDSLRRVVVHAVRNMAHR